MNGCSSGDYLSVKKRKLFMHNTPNKSSSAYIENKQFKIIQTNINKDFEVNQRFSITLPNEPLAFGIHKENDREREFAKNQKEMEEFYRYHYDQVQQQWYHQQENAYAYGEYIYNQNMTEHKYQILLSRPIILKINKITVDFIAGEYENLSKMLTADHVLEITKKIMKLKTKSSNKVMQQIIKTYLENFNIIVDFLNLNKTFENSKRHVTELEKITSILKDKQALLEYLKKMNPPELLAVSIDAPYLEIKQEYEEYHRQYGIPEHLNYDLGKLNHIKHHFTCFKDPK